MQTAQTYHKPSGCKEREREKLPRGICDVNIPLGVISD